MVGLCRTWWTLIQFGIAVPSILYYVHYYWVTTYPFETVYCTLLLMCKLHILFCVYHCPVCLYCCAMTQTSLNYLDTRMHKLFPSIRPLTNSIYVKPFLFQNINLNDPDLHEWYIASCVSNWAEFTDVSTSRVLICLLYRVRHKSVNTPLSHERLVGGLQDGGRGTHVTHFVQLYPQPLHTASQVRTTSCSWDEGVLTDLCLTLYFVQSLFTAYRLNSQLNVI